MIRDVISTAIANIREAAAGLVLVLFIAFAVIGGVALFQSCTTGNPPLQHLRR